MKLNLSDGSQGDGFTLAEYNAAVASGKIPGFISFLDRNLAGFTEWYLPHKVDRFYVECVQNYFTKQDTWWVRFDMGEYQVQFCGYARPVRDKIGRTMLNLYKGVEIRVSTDVDSRIYKFDGADEMDALNLAMSKDSNRVVFYLEEKKWGCLHTGIGRNETYYNCPHVREFIRSGKDATAVQLFLVSEEDEMTISVPVMDGLRLIPVTISKFLEDDVLDNGNDNYLIKFKINEDYQTWADMENPSMNALLEQFEGGMSHSFEMKKWYAACVKLRTALMENKSFNSISTPCPNKFHSKMDNYRIALECSSVGVIDEAGLARVALENTISVAVESRCTSCAFVKSKMAGDIVKQDGREFSV